MRLLNTQISVLVTLIGLCPIMASANPLTRQQKLINGYIDQLKINTPFTKDEVKAIAWVESTFTQFNKNGTPFTDGSLNRGTGRISHDVGVFQLNEDTLKGYKLTKKQIHRVKTDANFNVCMGLSVLEGKLAYVKRLKASKKWPKIQKKYGLKGLTDEEIAILFYNGAQKNHIYLRLVKQALKSHPWGGETPKNEGLNAK